MLGIRFIRSQPTTHLMQFRNGAIVREGAGLAFWYFAPTTMLVAVPLATQESHFMLELVTADYQAVTAQGQVTFRIREPRQAAQLVDFSLDRAGVAWASEDPKRLPDLVSTYVEIIIQQAVQALPLRAALLASAQVASEAQARLAAHPEVLALGLEVLGVSVAAVKPKPDIARALEAESREANLKAADEAVYRRRMGAVDNERAIRENELQTEVAVEAKRRQIREHEMDTKAAVMRRENALRDEQLASDTEAEARRADLVDHQVQNARQLSEADAFRVGAVMRALESADHRVVQALAAAGMQPGQLIAQAFGGLAERAQHIGQLNVSPELLQSLLAQPAAASAAATAAAGTENGRRR